MEKIRISDTVFGITKDYRETTVECYINKFTTEMFNKLKEIGLPNFGYSPYGGSIKWKYDKPVTSFTINEDIKRFSNTLCNKEQKGMTAKEYINKLDKPLTEFEKSMKKLNEPLRIDLSDRHYTKDEYAIKPSDIKLGSPGMKFDNNKNRMDLIPPETLESLGSVLTYGANKYGSNNWQDVEKERYTAALLRHLVDYMKDPKSKDESGLLHIEHVLCNAAFLSYFETHKEKDNTWHNKIKELTNGEQN